MLGNRARPRIPLPKQWPKRVRSGALHAISLAHLSLTFTRSWAANGWNARLTWKSLSFHSKHRGPLLFRQASQLGTTRGKLGEFAKDYTVRSI